MSGTNARETSSHDARVLRAWAAGRLGARRGKPEVIFGQVREDAAVEVAALQTVLNQGVVHTNLVCIGSGGCTGFSLLSVCEPSRLLFVDINPAQTHLLRLKRAVLSQDNRQTVYEAVTRDARLAFARVQSELDSDTRLFWAARLSRLDRGLNHCGRIDRRLALVMRVFHALFQRREDTRALLAAPNINAQRAIFAKRWNHKLIRAVLRVGLSRPALRLVYGPEFVRLAPHGLGDFAARGLERVFCDLPARTNPYLWQAFLGRYPDERNEPSCLPPYLQAQNLPHVRVGLASAAFVVSDMASVLESLPPGSLHFVALSNILEGMSETYGRRLFSALSRVAHTDAVAVLRFLLPPPPGWESWLGAGLVVDTSLSEDLEARDRGLFCRYIRAIRPTRGTTR